MSDPRIQRTREHVLSTVRRLLAEPASAPLTFTVLAAEAQVSRRTLYTHWGSIDRAISDAVTNSFGGDAEDFDGLTCFERLQRFLTSARDGMRDPVFAATVTTQIAKATRDPEAAASLREMNQAAIAKFNVGPSLDETSRLGPLVSAAQRDRVIGFIRTGIEEGADVIAGGADAPAIDKGYFVQPTILGIKATDTLAQEEVFGPVLVVIPYKDEDDAVAIANSTIYGLAGAVWGGSDEHAMKVARRLRTGQVDINGGAFNPLAPFGGTKQSGNGRELGKYGLEEFLEYKALQFKPAPKA